jgi:SAM-dependent methyltransferase
MAREFWGYLRDSSPERRRSRYGDMEYDWEHRVNTTSGSVGWRERLLGVFHSPYQPTDAGLFGEMMDNLPIDFSRFTFVDLGSGKGRTLLMASEYPFRRIVGVELMAGLHQIAQENLSTYKSDSQKCFALEAICGDATEFPIPDEPLVLYLFNPLPESGLKRLMASLQDSLNTHPRAVYVLYHNPLLEDVLSQTTGMTKVRGTGQYSLYANRKTAAQK